VAAYKTYVSRFPDPIEQATEARFRLAEIYKAGGEDAKRRYWLNEIVKADRRAGSRRTERTRYLAAHAEFELAEPAYAAFKAQALTIPLKTSLKAKKRKMELALDSYRGAAEHGIAEVTTASTYRMAEIYHDLSKALLASQRPKNLSQAELEQYDILLEEQAYPFEEKAIEIHELNARRAADGIYDPWVRRSFDALAKLVPARYNKPEKVESHVAALH
jgi:hypothetical protein